MRPKLDRTKLYQKIALLKQVIRSFQGAFVVVEPIRSPPSDCFVHFVGKVFPRLLFRAVDELEGEGVVTVKMDQETISL
jgi:hypothetical protein